MAWLNMLVSDMVVHFVVVREICTTVVTSIMHGVVGAFAVCM